MSRWKSSSGGVKRIINIWSGGLMRNQRSIIALGFLPCLITLAACSNTEIKLPENPVERAATCYAATITQISATEGALTPEQANRSAQFAYLGAVSDGMAEPRKLPEVMQKAEAIRAEIKEAGNAADYQAACAKAYPSTVTGGFKNLPADDRSTRMICFTLSTAAMQAYESSSVTPPVPTANLNAKLDAQLRDEINAKGDVNPAEIAGLAMRSMAKAVELGPMNEVLAACTTRYAAM